MIFAPVFAATWAAWLSSIAVAAGAPPATTIVCNPQLPATAIGQTYVAADRIELGPQACLGLFLAWISPADRQQVQDDNPAVAYAPENMGAGLLAIVHEAQHARGIRDEAQAEACAMQRLPAVAVRFEPADVEQAVVAEVQAYDAALPAIYKGGTCA